MDLHPIVIIIFSSHQEQRLHNSIVVWCAAIHRRVIQKVEVTHFCGEPPMPVAKQTVVNFLSLGAGVRNVGGLARPVVRDRW
jgi:hypothetical protein